MTDAVPPIVETDEDVRQAIIDTVRRFVAKDVLPVASDLEHADEFPAAIVEKKSELGSFGVPLPEAPGGLGSDHKTYNDVIGDMDYGGMRLTALINTNTLCSTLVM